MSDENEVLDVEETTLADALDRALRGRTVVLASAGHPVAALLGIESLRRLTDERELLRRLALGELESAAGEGDDLAAVLEDCRLLIEEN